MRGPGETQLETDRRLIRVRIKKISEHLEKVRKRRALGRHARGKAAVPMIALVGYTNAGKSAIFNRLTQVTVYSADKLFATLDPTLRRIELSKGYPLIIADTVGFIQQLPHELVDAFRATLEETLEADLLIHVIDVESEVRDHQVVEVTKVLQAIGANNLPILEVYNKIDQFEVSSQEALAVPKLERDVDGLLKRVWISALTGQGMDLLLQAINELLFGVWVEREILLTVNEMSVRSWLYAAGAVLQEIADEAGGCVLRVRLPAKQFAEIAHFECRSMRR